MARGCYTAGIVKHQMQKDGARKLRTMRNFLAGRLIHTNLQLLYACNFRCQICDFWQPSYKDAGRLSACEVSLISNKLAQIGPQIVSIGGGEPLLHPEIVNVVRALSRHHFPVMICNGWFMTPELARQLWQAGIYEVSISIDYAHSDRHDAQRGVPGAHARALQALRVLNETRVHPLQRVHMISVIFDDNLDDVEPLIQTCRAMGITYLITLYSDTRGQRSSRPIDRNVSQRLLDLKRKYPEFVALRGYLSRFSQAVEEGGIGPCQAGRMLCNIDSRGHVGLCIDRVSRVSESVGNILVDDMALLEARLRAAHRSNTCHACWTSCRGNIESMRDPKNFIGNVWDYHRMSRAMDLVSPA